MSYKLGVEGEPYLYLQTRHAWKRLFIQISFPPTHARYTGFGLKSISLILNAVNTVDIISATTPDEAELLIYNHSNSPDPWVSLGHTYM